MPSVRCLICKSVPTSRPDGRCSGCAGLLPPKTPAEILAEFDADNEPPATDRQLEYIDGLMEKKRLDVSDVWGWMERELNRRCAVKELRVGEASRLIDWLIEEN
jgi:hypothetical protein